MLKSYHIPQEVLTKYGMTIPEGRFRLNNTQEVTNPKEADVVVFSMPLRDHTAPVLDKFAMLKVIEDLGVDKRRVVAYDCSDDTWHGAPELSDCMFIRCNLKPNMKRDMPRSIPWFWPVEDYKECIQVPEGGFKYDVSGHMWVTSHIIRKQATDSCLNYQGIVSDIRQFNNFTGYVYSLPEGIEKRKNFRISMRDSRICLCPLSIIWVFPYRYYEAMSAGRVAALICDDASFPFADKINYDIFTIRIKNDDAPKAGQIIKNWLNNHSDKDLIERGLYARECWEKWLDCRKQESLYTIAIEEKLKADGWI